MKEALGILPHCLWPEDGTLTSQFIFSYSNTHIYLRSHTFPICLQNVFTHDYEFKVSTHLQYAYCTFYEFWRKTEASEATQNLFFPNVGENV